MTEKILATFRIEPEQWEAFKNKAKANGTNASAVLLNCVAHYLDDNDSEQNLDSQKTDNLEAHLDTEPLSNLDKNLEKKVKDYLDNSLVSHLDKYLDSRLDEKVRDYLDKQGNELNSLKQQVEALQSEMKKGLEREQEKQPIEDKAVATVHLNQHPDGEGNTEGKAPDNPIRKTKAEMTVLMGISLRTMDNRIRQAKEQAKRESRGYPTIEHEGQQWRYIDNPNGSGKVFELDIEH